MTTKLEQVARAIWDAYRLNAAYELKHLRSTTWEELCEMANHPGAPERIKEMPGIGRTEARAAIEAMKGPTTEMKRALIIHRGYDPDAKEETLDRLGQLDIATMHVFISAYEAMIDAALEEK